MLLPSIENVGMLFDRSWTDEEHFKGNGNCSVCINETVNRFSGRHASRNQVPPSAARMLAMYSVPLSPAPVVYAQPPWSLISLKACSAETFTTTRNAAKHAPAGMAHDRTRPASSSVGHSVNATCSCIFNVIL